jgi:DNA-binding GntR family transcriptional regulator
MVRARDVAYDRLREDIIEWRLEPGRPLGEVDLAAAIGVSRTPVREALARLTAEGLVTAGHGRTSIVAPMSTADIRQLFELREALETQAARLAARHRKPAAFEELRRDFVADAEAGFQRLHELADRLDGVIDDAIDNPYLRGALADVHGQLRRVRRHAHSNPQRPQQASAEHVLIIDAILVQDETLAAHATAVHLHRSLENVLAGIPPLSTEKGTE